MNQVILEGRLGKDPILFTTKGGQKVANFSLATQQRFNDKQGNKVERTQWHRVTCWGKLGERVAQYLTSGRRVLLTGRIEYSEYEDKETKQKRYSTTIVANQVTFLDRAKGKETTTTIESDVMDVPEEVLNPPMQTVGDEPAPF